MASKTSIQAIGLAFSILKASSLFNAVGGKFFKGKKTDGFEGECVVIVALPMTKGQLQVCRIMVNIHVPNLRIGEDKSQANYPRIDELSMMLEEVMTAYDKDCYSFRIEDDHVIENEGFNEHYSNYRLIFRNENL